jgi:hypothetical protein
MNIALKATPIINNYSYRYLHDKHSVYYLAKVEKNTKHTFYNSCLYTVPFQNNVHNIRNVLIGFDNKDSCKMGLEYWMDQKLLSYDDERDIIIEKSTLSDLKYLSSVMTIPLIVIMKQYCELEKDSYDDHFEIFYHFRETKDNKYKKI